MTKVSEGNRGPRQRPHRPTDPPNAQTTGSLRISDADSIELELLELLAACQNGADSRTIAADDQDAFTDGQEELEETKRCLRLLARMWPRSDTEDTRSGSTQPHVSRATGDGKSLEVDHGGGGDNLAASLGRFRILRELGRGGHGIVFLALDSKLDRQVALKVPLPDCLLRPDLRRRFLQEGQASAGLNHPNIVSVYEAGEIGAICYIASTYCDGLTLADWLKQQSKAVDPSCAARLVSQLAHAAEHAHAHGILHRDLKPGNVLLEARESGRPIPTRGNPCETQPIELEGFTPKLSDFGLAKLQDGGSHVTCSGTVLGTPSYMAPEQAAGRVDDIGPATDVYALGAILYELLTGRPPFHCDSDLQTMSRIISDQPRRPRQIRPTISRDLEAICLKCLEKDSSRRYRRAADLAMDLDRFLALEPTRARRSGPMARAAKWIGRKKTVTALIALVLLSSAVGLVDALRSRRVLARVEKTAAEHELDAQQRRLAMSRHDYADAIQGAYRAWQNADVTSALEMLKRFDPKPGTPDMRGFEWHYVRRLCEGGLRTLRGHVGTVSSVSVAPNGQLLASGGKDGFVRLWNVESGDLVAQFHSRQSNVHRVAFSPDGHLLATIGSGPSVTLWNVNVPGKAIRVFRGHTAGVECLAFSPDARLLATAGQGRTIRLWDVETGEQQQLIEAHDDTIYSLAFSPDGNKLVSGSGDKTAKIWNLDSLQDPPRTVNPEKKVYAVSFSPDGSILATAGELVHIWNLATNDRPILLPGHENYVRAIAFSPDGELLASTGDDLTVRVWNLVDFASNYVYRAHTKAVCGLAFSPVENILVSAGKDGTIRLWDADRPQDYRPLDLGLANRRVHVAIAPDNDTLAVISHGLGVSDARIWRMSTKEQIRTCDQRSRFPFWSPAFSPDGNHLAISCHGGPVLLWEFQTQDDPRILDECSANYYHPCVFSPDGQNLAVSTELPNSVRILDVDTGRVTRLRGLRGMAFSPNGNYLATEIEDFGVGLWDLRTQRKVVTLAAHKGHVYSIQFSPNGRFLATGSGDGTAKIWDLQMVAERSTLRGHVGAVYRAVFAPEGMTLATAGEDGAVKLWDVQTGRLLLALPVLPGRVYSMSFSRDGNLLAVGHSFTRVGAGVVLWEAQAIEGTGDVNRPYSPSERSPHAPP